MAGQFLTLISTTEWLANIRTKKGNNDSFMWYSIQNMEYNYVLSANTFLRICSQNYNVLTRHIGKGYYVL